VRHVCLFEGKGREKKRGDKRGPRGGDEKQMMPSHQDARKAVDYRGNNSIKPGGRVTIVKMVEKGRKSKNKGFYQYRVHPSLKGGTKDERTKRNRKRGGMMVRGAGGAKKAEKGGGKRLLPE